MKTTLFRVTIIQERKLTKLSNVKIKWVHQKNVADLLQFYFKVQNSFDGLDVEIKKNNITKI